MEYFKSRGQIHKNEHGYYIIVGIGNYVYLPEKQEDIVDFIEDWFTVKP
jgi:hypothetical protein